MPYEPTPIIIYDDLQADPPVIQDQNTAAWAKANANFEAIAPAIEEVMDFIIDLDADILELSYIPTAYTPTLTPSAETITQLAAHLKGIDDELASKSDTTHNHDTTYTPIAHASAATPHSGHEVTSAKNAANGYAGLGADGKVSTNQLPATVLGSLQYKGVWDCSQASYPTLPETGDYYVASVQGTISTVLYRVGDWLVYDGSAWSKVDNATVVSSVAGRTGAVTLTTADVADSSDKRYCSDAQKTVIGNTSGTNSGNETTTTVGALINGATAKTAPVDADHLGLMDSESSNPANVLKKLSWAYVKSVLKTYFDGLYTLANLGGVPTSRTVAGHALTDNVTVSASDVGLGNVSNVAQMPSSYLDTDNTLATNSDTKVASQKAIKTYTDTGLGTKAATGHSHDSAYTAASHASAASPHSGHENTANKAAASGYASLDASSLVVQNPASAQTTSAPSKIPIADLNGSVDDFVTPFVVDLDTDQLALSFIPANYTPTVTPSCETTIQLAAQLKGIDLALKGILDRLTAHSI